MQPDFELGLLDANEITSTTASTATTPSTPPIIQISRAGRCGAGAERFGVSGRKYQHGAESRLSRVPRSALLFVFALHLFHHHVASRAQIDYFALALGAFASWVGVPGPGEPLLIAAGIVAAKHKLDIKPGPDLGVRGGIRRRARRLARRVVRGPDGDDRARVRCAACASRRWSEGRRCSTASRWSRSCSRRRGWPGSIAWARSSTT